MNSFLNNNFLLQTETARRLYFEYAAGMPIVDYHCHLSPKDIAEDRRFANLTEAWLEGDHYKWRAMRGNGVAEKYITGDGSDRDKFRQWAATVPYTLRNPLYHWTHLELQRYFDIHTPLSPETADEIYDKASEMLQSPEFSCRALLRRQNVKAVGTTDDPLDDLKYHDLNNADNPDTRLHPTWRPDRVLNINDGEAFKNYLNKLAEITGQSVNTFEQMLQALEQRMEYFDAKGCRMSDISVQTLYATKYTEKEIASIFQKVMKGEALSELEVDKYKTAFMYEMGIRYHKFNWTMQLHIGPLRNNSERRFKTLGPDTGFDSIGDWPQAEKLSKYLSRLDLENQLPRTVIYNLNPADNYVMGSMIGNFQDEGQPGKIQFGSGWWFLDQKEGMEMQINALSNLGLLSKFIGMLTDSRSLLSYPRHEYFRRILCNLFGNDIENGLLPNDIEWTGKIIQDICYNNIVSYGNFHELKTEEVVLK